MLASPFMHASSPSSFGFIPLAFWGTFAVLFLFALAIIAALVFVYYHIYKSFDPDNAILFTILSALGFSFIFLFVIRNKKSIYQEKDEMIKLKL